MWRILPSREEQTGRIHVQRAASRHGLNVIDGSSDDPLPLNTTAQGGCGRGSVEGLIACFAGPSVAAERQSIDIGAQSRSGLPGCPSGDGRYVHALPRAASRCGCAQFIFRCGLSSASVVGVPEVKASYIDGVLRGRNGGLREPPNLRRPLHICISLPGCELGRGDVWGLLAPL